MSDVDEAMLCARRRAMQHTNPALRDEIAAGLLDHAFGMVEFADGYRTAAAASADRIKELELFVAQIAHRFVPKNVRLHYLRTLCSNESVQARALLKEPDQ